MRTLETSASWIFANAYACPSGIWVGGNIAPGGTLEAGATLLSIELWADAEIPPSMVGRGCFHMHQSAALVSLSGRTLTVKMEQRTVFAIQDTFSMFIPIRWL